jgi:hypothetical protein
MHELFECRKATDILLADGWHEIADGSLEGVNYEFSMTRDSVPHAGVRWREIDEAGEKVAMFAPLGQVLAISGGWPEPEAGPERSVFIDDLVGVG